MDAIAIRTDFRLWVSAKLAAWVAGMDAEVQDAFDAALAFAEAALPRAATFLEPAESLVVVHYASVLVLRLDRVKEGFCVIAFHFDPHDTPPPDGPRPTRHRPLAEVVLDHLGLPPETPALKFPLGSSPDLEPAAPISSATDNAHRAVESDHTVGDGRAATTGASVAAAPNSSPERDLHRSRSSLSWTIFNRGRFVGRSLRTVGKIARQPTPSQSPTDCGL